MITKKVTYDAKLYIIMQIDGIFCDKADDSRRLIKKVMYFRPQMYYT